MKTRNLAPALVTAALAATALTGCGGSDAPAFTFSGAKVNDPGGALKSFEQNWRSNIAQSDTQTRIAKDAKCFYQVMDKEITKTLLCGPFREAGSKETAWSSTTLTSQPASDGKVTLGFEAGSDVEWDDSASPLPNAVPMTADGTKANTSEVVDQPDAQEQATGTAELLTEGGPSVGGTPPMVFAVDGGRWAVSTSTAAPDRYAGEGKDRRQAPKGSVLLAFTVQHFLPEDSSDSNKTAAAQKAENSTTFTLTSGGKTINLPKPAVSGSMTASWRVSVPGDGKDAKVNITADKGTQTVALNGGKVTGVTEGWNPDVATIGTKQPLTQQSQCTDSSSSGQTPKSSFGPVALACTVKWNLAPYLPEKGWAPKGSQWWQVLIAPSTTSVRWYDNDGLFSTSYKTTATISSASLDGAKETTSTEVTQPTLGEPTKYRAFTFSVKNDAVPTSLKITGSGTGTAQSSFRAENAPSSWSGSNLTGEVHTD